MSHFVLMERRGAHALRKGRYSRAGARYFVTGVVADRERVLDEMEAFNAAESQLARWAADEVAANHAFLLMPDHFHWLFSLGHSHSLSQVVRMLRFRLGSRIRDLGFNWQSGFFEHQLRDHEDLESFARYIFMNPYRAGLVSLDEVWPFWIGDKQVTFRFEAGLREGKFPHPEWLVAFENPLDDG